MLLAIVEVLKTWHYHLEGCKHKVFVLTDHNNLCWFIDINNFWLFLDEIRLEILQILFQNLLLAEQN